jgi:signal transduction histidine kinase
MGEGESTKGGGVYGEETMRERELREQLQTAQAITHIGSWDWTLATNEVRWSDELYRIYGYQPGAIDVTLEVFLAHIRPNERERIKAEIQAVLVRPGRFFYREVIIRPDRSERILDTIGDAITDDNGNVIRLVGTCRDVTDNVARDERLQFFADVFQHAEIGLSAWRLDQSTEEPRLRLVACNEAMEHLCGVDMSYRLGATLSELVPEALTTGLRDMAKSVAAGGRVQKPPPFRRTGIDRSPILAPTLFALSNHMVGIALEDVTDRVLTEAVQNAERRSLEMLASGEPLEAILQVIARAIEESAPGTFGSVVLLDESGTRIKRSIAPSIPDDYSRAIEGLQIGPRTGSCGTAMYRRQPVIVEDIELDVLWDDYRELARAHKLRSCWSQPIISSDGRVLGSFAVYGKTPRRPPPEALPAMERGAHVTSLIIERRLLDEELRALAGRIEAAREEERTTIARDIHDQLGQALTALRLDIGWLQRRLEDEAIRKKLDDMAQTTDDVLVTVRRISADLRPGVLDTLGLRAAVEWQAEEFQKRTGMKVTVASDVTDLQLDRELSTNMFRIFQEALTNIARHSAAANVEVSMKLERGQLRLEISDDGIGMPEIAPRGSSLGLLGMRERARRLGGDCVVKRRQPRGTVVTVTVPLRFPAERTGSF